MLSEALYCLKTSLANSLPYHQRFNFSPYPEDLIKIIQELIDVTGALKSRSLSRMTGIDPSIIDSISTPSLPPKICYSLKIEGSHYYTKNVG